MIIKREKIKLEGYKVCPECKKERHESSFKKGLCAVCRGVGFFARKKRTDYDKS